MIRNSNQTILVVNDIDAARKSIEELLTRDGFQIETAQDERSAANAARFRQPDLMLVSLDGEIEEVIESVRRIRENAELDENVPIIIFCADESDKKNETAVETNTFLSCPDNFNGLRSFISRLLMQFQTSDTNLI
jgi:DNA-binding response OmpR family regulator